MDLPDDDALRWIVTSYAHLRAAHGAAFEKPELVQPTADYFPDPFDAKAPTAAQVEALMRRMLAYTPIADDLALQFAVIAPEGSGEAAGGCGSIACGSAGASGWRGANVEELEDGYRVLLAATDASHPEVLTTSLARAAGALVLHEASEEVTAEAGEIAAVSCGLGVLLVNGAAVWAKSCGGLRMAQATTLSVSELAVALALFTAVCDRSRSHARKHLGATQREALDVAFDWVDSNLELVDAVRERPAWIETGVFELHPVRGILGQWLQRRRAARERAAAPPAPPTITAERRRWLEEAKALVDDVETGR